MDVDAPLQVYRPLPWRERAFVRARWGSAPLHRMAALAPASGRIADVVHIDLPRPRGAHTRSEPRFVEHVERIRQHFLALGVLSET